MSLSPIKQEILESMFLNEKLQKATEIAQETKKEYRPVNMHLLGLVKMGYVCLPEKGQYLITEKGKKALGIADTTKEKAATILSYAPHDKSFNFYAAVGKPLNQHAHSLKDFANKLQRIDISSLEFHTQRGDFEAWLKCLGDEELAKKLALIKKKGLIGEDLRKQLHQVVERRYVELSKLAGQPIPME